jgi:hypothetical protein
LIENNCKICLKFFLAKTKRRIYCSKKCQLAANAGKYYLRHTKEVNERRKNKYHADQELREKKLAYQNEYRLAHVEQCKQAGYAWRIKNNQKFLEQTKKWRINNNQRFLEQHKKDAKNYRLKFPEKAMAHILSQKIKIKSNDACYNCGGKTNLEKHHPNYNQPLNIIILCRKCHHKIHSKRGD